MSTTTVTVGLYKTIRCLGMLRWQLRKQERYIREQLPPLLATLAAGQPQSFSEGSVKRITKYWQLSLNVICNSLYKLSGRQLSEDEQQRILLLSIFGPLYDDLFDDKLLSEEQIEAFTLAPEKHVPASFEEHTAQKAYLQLLELVPDREKVIAHLHCVFIWQKASLQQLSPDISEATLYEVTYKKSYYSILLFYSILDHYPTPAMLEMLYPMSGLLQLTNDAFDVYKDVHNGIYTVPNLYRNFDRLLQHFMQDVAQFNHFLAKLPFLERRKETYSITIHALHAMGRMALEQLKESTRGVNSLVELAALSRKALVCDMDNYKQQLKWIRQVQLLVNYQALVAAPPSGLTVPV